ncbi:adenylate cyclase-like protein [Leptomonas seymouri]|uniref:Adenylate cyclase-like protein n=1 Tax=Leptomonas seymouri TaxID=5684 RepID=A0A0N0P721_LEPSE|nr:adenylate cyclase-like protein [Leptomonas seymouri]|eukprot:KPI88296.1 adenylate cyclase-like protein [Leptomonas seymouri]
MGGGISRSKRSALSRKKRSDAAMQGQPVPAPSTYPPTLPVYKALSVAVNGGSPAMDSCGCSAPAFTPSPQKRECDSWDTPLSAMAGLVDSSVDHLVVEMAPAANNQNLFHETLTNAAMQLRARQRDANVSISKAEMEDLVLLTRELENLKQIMKRSQFTVQGTWNILEKEGMLERFAQQLYDELLTQNARLRVYFYGVDLDEQSKSLVRMIGTAVHFYEKPQVTVEMFTKAGARHRGYGVNGEVFEEMRDAFFRVFPKFVGADVFSAAEEEWQKFWKLMLDLLQHGSESPEGERYSKLHEEQTCKKIQADFRLIIERQSKFDTRHQFIGTMYGKAIEMYGDLSKFEALKDLRASRRVFQSFVDLINNIQDKSSCEQFMRELGGRHTAYNVTIENLRSFVQPFLFACRHFMQDEWNVAVEARFMWLFDYMIQGISAGMMEGINSLENQRAPSNSSSFGILFTDIEASTKLWGKDSETMSMAVKAHHALVRQLIADFGAYEVKTVGDSFIIATKDVLVAVKLALALQLELMRLIPIAPGFEMIENTEGRGDPQAWDKRTLRVRIGIEYCTDATAIYDSIHRRYDYYGPSVNRCARIESSACGGQILMSRQTFEQLKSIPEFHDEPASYIFRSVKLSSPPPKVDKRGLDHFIAVGDVGFATLKGIAQPVHLVSMVPRCLAGRQFIDKISKVVV